MMTGNMDGAGKVGIRIGMFDDIVEHFGDDQSHHADLFGLKREAGETVQQERQSLPRGVGAAVNGDLKRAKRRARGGLPHGAIPGAR